MTKSSIGHLPGSRWAFDESVTAVFDDMIARSIPDYQAMRDTVTTFAADASPKGEAVDVGCSNGLALAALLHERRDMTGVGLEVSEPMLVEARRRFAREPR